MARTTYVLRGGALIDKRDAPPLHAAAAAPMVRPDGMPPLRSMADGRIYDSRSAFYSSVRRAGCEIVGDERAAFERRPAFEPGRAGSDIKTAIEQLRSLPAARLRHRLRARRTALMRIVLGRDPEVADWVARRIPHVGQGPAFGPCAAIGVEAEDGRPLGGVVYSNWQPACRSIEASFASATPRWLTRRILAAILAYPFDQLDCQRITALTPRKAKAARRFLDAFGFKREGLVRKGFGDDDAVVSGLMRREWEGGRWALRPVAEEVDG